MYRKLALGFIALSLLLAANVDMARAATMPMSCTGQFEATITRGPDTGTVLQGAITLTVGENGRISGTLIQNDNSSLNVAGFFHAPVIGLDFGTSLGTIIGVGELPGGFTPCASNFGGNFVGPKFLDRGNWGIIWGS
jgi:hypothetical protein